MKRLSKTIISSISVIAISSSFYSGQVNAKNDHSTNQNKLEIKDKNKAFQALKLLPNDKNAKKQFKHYKTVDVNTDQLGYTHYTLQPKFKMHMFLIEKLKYILILKVRLYLSMVTQVVVK